MADLTPTLVAQTLGISLPYASQLLSGARGLSRERAILIYRATGHRIGPIRDATDADIAVLERFEDRTVTAVAVNPGSAT